ncbi:MAG: tRNA (N6-isopentenyl adenosine(37)-C2)-methylthiotransferase MiaB [Kiritimatiellae bacterium]|jgi:tRNA-2-methylthio-N6-dimethylallyladenosine synthase|nr:tRNA (N6-isopentenyl adenosine(37)-C2)-methylthiotransferase MiaB [Kiritimatiellia bacterium]
MKFRLHTYGCQMNVRDSDAVAAMLTAAGHQQSVTEDEADFIIVNSCSVREKAEDKAMGKLGLLCKTKRERPERKVALMGCMAQRMGKDIFKKIPLLDFTVGTRRCGTIPQLVQRVLDGETNIIEISKSEATPDVPDSHNETGYAAFVTILLGCNRRCAYCIVPDVRGPEFSRPAKEILTEITALTKHGIREVTLLGQSVMNYGLMNSVWDEHDSPSPGGYTEAFSRLLEAVATIPEIQRIRFTSSHPSGCTEEMVRAMNTLPKVCHHLHLAVQSGSNRILKLMRRGYTREEYLDAITRLRAAMPDFSLTSDIIVGFPGETEQDFEETRSLMEQAQFDNAFIFKYSTRPGTPAAEMNDDVSKDEKMRRNQVLLADLDIQGQKKNEALIGSIQEILVDGPSLRNAERWAGRTPGNKIAVFTPREGLTPGTLVKVRIIKAAPQTLYGEIV